MESTEKEMLVTVPPVYHQRCDVSGTDLRHAVQDGLDAKKLEKIIPPDIVKDFLKILIGY